MTTVTAMKCACDQCLCVVSLEEAISKNGKYYCCEACANGHVNSQDCGNKGCSCG